MTDEGKIPEEDDILIDEPEKEVEVPQDNPVETPKNETQEEPQKTVTKKTNEAVKPPVEEKQGKSNVPSKVNYSNDPAPGTEDIQPEDTMFPRFRLLQSTSTEVEAGESKPGLIKNSLTEEEHEKIEIVPLMMKSTRIMFNIEDRKGPPICRSKDMIIGTDCNCGCNNQCRICEYAKWLKNSPPACSISYNYPCLSTEQIQTILGVGEGIIVPTLLTLMKSSTAAAHKMNTLMKWSVPPQPFWNYVWELSVKQDKFKKGVAFVYLVRQIRATTAEEREVCKRVYEISVASKRDDIEPEYTPEEETLDL